MLFRWRFLSLTGLGVLRTLISIAVSFIVADLFWGWLLMVAMGAWGPHGTYQWGYWYTVTHWGLLTPLVLGGLRETRDAR